MQLSLDQNTLLNMGCSKFLLCTLTDDLFVSHPVDEGKLEKIPMFH